MFAFLNILTQFGRHLGLQGKVNGGFKLIIHPPKQTFPGKRQWNKINLHPNYDTQN